MRVVSFFWKYAVASVAGGVRRAWEKISPWAAEYALPYAVGALTFCVVAGFHPGSWLFWPPTGWAAGTPHRTW